MCITSESTSPVHQSSPVIVDRLIKPLYLFRATDRQCQTVSFELYVVRLILLSRPSADIPPTVELLVKELKDVTNWYVFGVALGIPVSKLDRIKKENSEVEEQKVKMFQFWINNKLDASWKIVIQVLEQNDHFVLAAELSKKYLLTTADSSNEEQGTVYAYIEVLVVERLTDLALLMATILSVISCIKFFFENKIRTKNCLACLTWMVEKLRIVQKSTII